MSPPKMVPQSEWLAARKDLLAKEKEFTRQRDALSAARRKLPMVKVEKNYAFESSNGPKTLRDLFEGRRQLITYHFMFDPSWTEGCKGCSFVMDNIASNICHLAARDTSVAAISRAPFAIIEPFKKRMGWNVPWFSSFGNEFNYDFHVTLDPEKSDYSYNYASVDPLIKAGEPCPPKGEMPGLSVFLREGDGIFHTYSSYARGLDMFLVTYNLLDVTPLGRQEEPGHHMAWLRHHDKYTAQAAAGHCHCP
jgi:predicted dithiol-disulfide oxidoreductase (DUF899 family)